ncbi:hypothetical protein [Paraclostridium sordellii]|uniref:hypothetical protein n=1 Tax=Paraclostridium sordellii TaxID=1505 RepID=UPI0005E6F680|nr:hypothetical protein [Paeniclostridium sordellii]CEN24006.1 Uncharacterised protein [[Clostridium] sordellii] [Paeniclostridium sordellii]
MIEVKKIKEKVELKDMEINGDPCKYFWNQYHAAGHDDCMEDCTECKGWKLHCANGSDRY